MSKAHSLGLLQSIHDTVGRRADGGIVAEHVRKVLNALAADVDDDTRAVRIYELLVRTSEGHRKAVLAFVDGLLRLGQVEAEREAGQTSKPAAEAKS